MKRDQEEEVLPKLTFTYKSGKYELKFQRIPGVLCSSSPCSCKTVLQVEAQVGGRSVGERLEDLIPFDLNQNLVLFV